MKNGIWIFLGICILIAGSSIGSGLENIAENMNQSNTETNIESQDSYRFIVQDGIIYKYDTVTGLIWKKQDNPDAKWEEIEDLFDY